MKTQNLIEGIQILDKYRSNPGGHNVGAEHDVIYVYETTLPLPHDEVQQMINLGWHQEGDDIEYYDGEFTVDSYNPGSSWVAYT